MYSIHEVRVFQVANRLQIRFLVHLRETMITYNERSWYVRVFLLDSDLSLENGTSVRFDKELNQIKNKECLKEMLSVSCI